MNREGSGLPVSSLPALCEEPTERLGQERRNLWGQCVRGADREGFLSKTQQDFSPSPARVLELLRASSGHSNYRMW